MNCVDDVDEYNFVNDLSDDVQTDQVDDLIDLEVNEIIDELNDTQIEGVEDDVEQFMFQNLEHNNLDSEIVETWVLVQEPSVSENEFSTFTDKIDILFSTDIEQGIDALLSNFQDEEDIEIFYSDCSSTISERS